MRGSTFKNTKVNGSRDQHSAAPHITGHDNTVASPLSGPKIGEEGQFDLDREAGKLFAEIIKRRSNDPSAALPSQRSQANYQAFRVSVFNDPASNPSLKNTHNENLLDLQKDNEKNWHSSGHTWSRVPRFAKGQKNGGRGGGGAATTFSTGAERFLAQERFYDTDCGPKKTLYKGVTTSNWGISQASTTKKFDEFDRAHRAQTATEVGPGSYLNQPSWTPKEVCGDIPPSSAFSSGIKRDLFKASAGFRVIDETKEYKQHNILEMAQRNGSPQRGMNPEALVNAALGLPVPQSYGPLHVDLVTGQRPQTMTNQPSKQTAKPSFLCNQTWSGPSTGQKSAGATDLSINFKQHPHTQAHTSRSMNSAGSGLKGLSFPKSERVTFADEPGIQQQSYSKSYVRIQASIRDDEANLSALSSNRSSLSGSVGYRSRTDQSAESLGSLFIDENESPLMLRATSAPVHSLYDHTL